MEDNNSNATTMATAEKEEELFKTTLPEVSRSLKKIGHTIAVLPSIFSAWREHFIQLDAPPREGEEEIW